jgi:hypothetical protein
VADDGGGGGGGAGAAGDPDVPPLTFEAAQLLLAPLAFAALKEPFLRPLAVTDVGAARKLCLEVLERDRVGRVQFDMREAAATNERMGGEERGGAGGGGGDCCLFCEEAGSDIQCASCEGFLHRECAGVTDAKALENDCKPFAPPLEVFCGFCRDEQSRRRCRGSVVIFKLPDGTMGHWSLHEFTARAKEKRDSGDNSFYMGLALCIIMQHFAVNEDAALKQGAKNADELCTSFRRLFAALEVAWASSAGTFRAVICADPTLEVELPTAFRDAKLSTSNPAWTPTISASLVWLFALRRNPQLAQMGIILMSSNTVDIAETAGLLADTMPLDVLPPNFRDYVNGVLSVGTQGFARTGTTVHLCANPSQRHALLNVVVLASVLHGADARAAPFADAVGTSVEGFVKALPSADFRRVTDVRNRGVIFAALKERMPTLTARAALALITFAGGELARVVALVKDQLAAQVGGGAGAVDAYLDGARAWVLDGGTGTRPSGAGGRPVLVHDEYAGVRFVGEDVLDLLKGRQSGKSPVKVATSATALIYAIARYLLAGRGGRCSGFDVLRAGGETEEQIEARREKKAEAGA